ncbi:hypothetical protein QAD02_010708 [Eretmocerus hayati]|uniref:Uncharacterized protein n=1 Tax=Eretmocerus hayati TaxID=131215 RepID=A0ACC2NXJ1_9HYME|nr:hypothetical protein QAD02_010708 [Eretmocerus hayati]
MDIILADGAYRDIENHFKELGLRYYRPAFLEAGNVSSPHRMRINRGAMINRSHLPIIMQGADAHLAKRMLDRAKQPNALHLRVENENLATGNAQRWFMLDDGQLNNFSILTKDN